MQSIATILGLTVAGALAIGVIWVLILAARNTMKNPHRKQRLRARPTWSADVKPAETVLLVGQIKPAGQLLGAPFSGQRCVGYLAAIERDVDPDDPDSVLGGILRQKLPATLRLEDEAGAVLVQLSPDSPVRISRNKSQTLRDVRMETVDHFLAEFGGTYDDIETGFPFGAACTTLPADFRAVEWLLVEGDRVSVVGQVKLEPTAEAADLAGGPREPPRRLVLGPEAGLPVQLNARADELAAEAKRRLSRRKRA